MQPQPVLIVCGSRSYRDYARFARVLDALIAAAPEPYAEIWHGAACGADALADDYGLRRNLHVRRWPADWARHRRAAGVVRSASMIAAAPEGSLVVAFVPTELTDSVGTSHTVRFARRASLPIVVVDQTGQRWLESNCPLLFPPDVPAGL